MDWDLKCSLLERPEQAYLSSLPTQDGLRQQEREETEKGVVVMAGRRYENRKRDLEQNAHGKQDRLQARQRQGELNRASHMSFCLVCSIRADCVALCCADDIQPV